MITRSKMDEMLRKVDTQNEKMKVIFESLTYKKAKNSPLVLHCIKDFDENFIDSDCDKYITCRSCKKAFIERYKQYFKKEKKGNISW